MRRDRYTMRAMQLFNQRPDAPGAAAARVRARELGQQVLREVEAKFGAITAENAAEVLAWQAARLRELEGVAPAPTTQEKETGRLP
jgi:hypothetical protein